MPDNQNTHKRLERKCQLWGWILFVVSAMFFIATSLRAGDMLGFLGGLFFLIACVVFLIPFFKTGAD